MRGPFVFEGGSNPAAVPLLQVSHDHGWVLLSLVLAFVSCCAAFYMAHSNRYAATRMHRWVSLLCASMVLGLGIWSMHFIGMLAMRLPLTISYGTWGTLASILPGMVAAFLALKALRLESPTYGRIAFSGAMVGIGIACMHYSGIAAIYVQGRIQFEPGLFLLSAVLGILLAGLAFGCHSWLLRHKRLRTAGYALLLPSGLMTTAIASMHYVSMQALRVDLSTLTPQEPLPSHLISNTPMLSWAVAIVAGLVFLLLGVANAMLRYRDLWQAVAARDARLQAMVETAEDGFISINAQGLIQEFNRSAEGIFGYRKPEVLGRNISMLMPSPLAEQHDGHLRKHIDKPDKAISATRREVLGKHRDGRYIPLQLSIGKATTAAGTIFVGYLQDISQRKRTDAQLRIAASVFHHVREGVAIVDANHDISDVNPAFLRLMELTEERCIGQSLESLYESADIPPDMSRLWQTVATAQYWQNETMFTRADGKVWMQRLSISPVLNEMQRPHHFIAVISDVSERPGLEVMLPHADLHDSGTGLAIHTLMMDRLTNSLLAARRKSCHVGLLVLQLCGAESATNTIPMGNALRLLAQLLQQQLRSTDTLARYQNNHLVVLLPEVKDQEALVHVMQRLDDVLTQALPALDKYTVPALQRGHASTLEQFASARELFDAALANLMPWDAPHALQAAQQPSGT